MQKYKKSVFLQNDTVILLNKFKSNLLIIFKDVYMLWNDSAYYKRIIH